MNLPKSIKIGGHKYKVTLKNLETGEATQNCGYCKTCLNELVINSELPPQQQESTLLHETLEAINWLHELKLEHNQLMSLEASLYQVLHDNKLTF